jgi:outer membrane protein
MRKVYPFLLAALALATFGARPAAAQARPKLGFINSQPIIAVAPGAQSARQTLEREMDGYRKEISQLEEQIQKLVTDYERKRSMLSADARTKEEEAIMQKQRDAQQRAMQLEDQAAKRQNELVEPVMRKIQEVIDSIRDEGKYAMIFDVAAGGVIAADPSLDLTDQVLARLRPTATNKR